MSIILKRPMFRKGGSVADGVGITSGLTYRKRFDDGGSASDNPMGDYVNTNDNDLYKAAQDADFSSDDNTNADNILRILALKDLDNKKQLSSNQDISTDISAINQMEPYGGRYDTGDLYDNLEILSQKPSSANTDKNSFYAPNNNLSIGEQLAGQVVPVSPFEPTKFEPTSGLYTPDQTKTVGEEMTTKPTIATKPTVDTTGVQMKPDLKNALDQFAEDNPIYNAQGQNITPSLINVSKVLKSQMTPSFSENLSSWLRNFGGTAKGPLDLQTWGSALGEASKEQAAQAAKNVQELNKYIGTVIGRTVGTLGKATTTTPIGKLSGPEKDAFLIASKATGILPKNLEEAINNPIFNKAWSKAKEDMGLVTPREKLESKDKATGVKKIQENYRITSPQAANNLFDMLEDVNKGKSPVKAENVDQKLPHIRDLSSTITDSKGNIKPVKNINSFNKYRENINYADPSTKKWYTFKRNSDGTDPRFEPVK